jgi:hypothetical protein
MFLLLAVSSCRIVAAQVEQAGDKTVNVKAFGAKGDGVADDTRAIQAAINHANAGEKIYFPPGIYDVSNFVVKNRSGLSFTGDGRQSMIRQKSGAARMATIEASSDIAITNLAFDANGIVSYGGVVFYAVKGVRIENNIFIDRAAKPIGSTDRYSFVFGRGSVPSQDVKILNNMIEDLQLEVDHAQRVLIDRNTVKRAIATAGIGIFTVGDKAIAEDYQITNNTILDPPGAGLSVGLDPPTDSHCIFRRITMAGNQVVRTKTAGYGIRIGTPNNSIKTTGNVFEDIEIKNNRFKIEGGAPQPAQVIFANSSPQVGIIFTRLAIIGNQIENTGLSHKGFAIDLRRIQKSMVTDNVVKGATNGMFLGGDLLSNEIRNNVVEARDIAFMLDGSLGGNKAANNRTIGNPHQGWKFSDLHKSDSVEQ